MKADELMIGNIGLIKNVPYSVTMIHFAGVIDAHNADNSVEGMSDHLFMPIEITPKLLLSIGFEKEPEDFLGYDMSDWFSIDYDEYHLSLRSGLSNTDGCFWSAHVDNADFQSIGSCDLQYLHQLQNFMNLVGYKLNINMEDLNYASKED